MPQLKILHATVKILRVATKTWHSQINNKKILKTNKQKESQPHLALQVQPWAKHFSSLGINFPTCKMGTHFTGENMRIKGHDVWQVP